MFLSLVFFFFFFQAEDGIRDRNVTGVQTCALPISLPLRCFIIVRFCYTLFELPSWWSWINEYHASRSWAVLQKSVPVSMLRIFPGFMGTATLVPWDMLWDTPGFPPGTKMHDYNTTRCRLPGAIGFSPIPPPAPYSPVRNSTNSWISYVPGTRWWCGDWIGWVVRFATSLISYLICRIVALSSERCKKISIRRLRVVDWCSIFLPHWPSLNAT